MSNPNPYGGGNANPGGPGGTRRVVKTSGSGGGGGNKRKCCPMAEAIVSVKKGNLRLARRYAFLAVRVTSGRIVRAIG